MKYWFLTIIFLSLAISTATGQHIGWLSDTVNLRILVSFFSQASLSGLNEKDYAYKTVQQLTSGIKIDDTASIDKELTNAAISYFSDIVYGNQEVRVPYNGINYYPACLNIRDSILTAMAEDQFATLPARLEPHNVMYMELKEKIAVLENRKKFIFSPVTSDKLDTTNHPLIEKLFQLGITDTPDYTIHEDTLRNKLRLAQGMFEMLEDGTLRPGILEELNISVEKRLYELKHALNTWRWLDCIQQEQPVIIVNIPAANLFYICKDSVLFYTRCIVGKAATPSIPLASSVHEVILFPYWNVPRSIAVNELLPAIQSAPLDYLDYGNYQVLDKAGKVLDPSTIKWQQLNSRNFPYTLRQLFGCDNSLGIIKLNFFSPYSTYLHDTPNKSYFMFNSRYFSHGCIRVEDVDSLAEMLEPALHPFLANAATKVCDLASDSGQLIFPLKHKIPLFILYEVAWPDGKGKICFYDDVYNKIKL
ncbi:L,D-transpeptidase family protein [Chitinophaga sp. LS1]|uniref:L,D-transpeptidase family protein n=1 Tax=Chitinophaga sp. LS1 TaxID=3051176 RepID=UPI002AABA04A|nr:L,D-transpeptidase family protein [Chitinophaga sp. LS1]WPV64623.1 L,D-transpeptidase family protein [Chitinophaga sp. LS1]